MPDLVHSLQSFDLGHLRIVAGLWGVDLHSPITESAAEELAACLLEPGLVGEIVETLPGEARNALRILTEAGGKLPWTAFIRQAGDLRAVGAGRRDREQIYLHPASACEVLFYRALLARAFFDTPAGELEFAYIPDDLLPIIREKLEQTRAQATSAKEEPLGRPAVPAERSVPLPSSDRLLDDATTLLAALRMGFTPPETPIPPQVVVEFLRAAGILDENSQPRPQQVKAFLEAPRQEALQQLAHAWQESDDFNELQQMPSLVCEGEWRNLPRATRRQLLDFVLAIPAGRWWSLPAFIHAVHEKHPDIQRTAGEYDTWFIKRKADGVYLRGFSAWEEVEGALIRYMLSGPLFWLGWVDLAATGEGGAPSAFRVRGGEAKRAIPENGKLHVASQGVIAIPRLFPRAVRYLVARFCEWEPERADEYRYRVSTASLKKAGTQKLTVDQLLSLLARHAAAEIPPAFIKALKRWQNNGVEARLETRTVLQVSRPEVLEELRRSKAGRFLAETLGPVAVVVKPGAQAKMLAALAELGLLAEIVQEPQSP